MLQSKLYNGPFQNGQRCVIICEGFYEWQTTTNQPASSRNAFFIYVPQKDDIKIENRTTWSNPSEIKLLNIAGLFNEWTNENGDRIYSYTVITFESIDKMSWMHHRMPAILETDKQVSDWLDFERVQPQQALALLKPASNFIWHQVSNLVNNSRNKSENCNKSLTDIKNKPVNKMMDMWLVKSKRKLEVQKDDEIKKEVKSEDASDVSKKMKLKE